MNGYDITNTKIKVPTNTDTNTDIKTNTGTNTNIKNPEASSNKKDNKGRDYFLKQGEHQNG